MGRVAFRVLGTYIGAATIAIGSFLPWALDVSGRDISNRAFWDPHAGTANFLSSAGFVTLVIACVALLGVLTRGGLTSMAGGAAIVAVVAFTVTLYRVPTRDLGIQNVQIGLWLVLAGGFVCQAVGFIRRRKREPSS